MIEIPLYVKELMSRASFVLGSGCAGYTIRIGKASEYGYVKTLANEVERLRKWVNRVMPKDYPIDTITVDKMPKETHYCKQYAIVTIYDPVMKWLEPYIKEAY